MTFNGLEKLEDRVLFSTELYSNPIPADGRFSYFGDNGIVEVKLTRFEGGSWETDIEGDLNIDVKSTDKTSLRIKGEADIERIGVNNGLKNLNAKDSDIESGGVIDIIGEARKIRLNDVLEGANINIDSVRSFRSDYFNGSYNADFTNSFQAEFLDNSIIYSLILNRFYSREGVVDSTIANVGNSISRFKSNGSVLNSDIGQFSRYSISGNLIGTNIDLDQNAKYVKVKGDVLNTVIINQFDFGMLERLTIGGDFRESSVFILWSPGSDRTFNTNDDVGLLNGLSSFLAARIRGNIDEAYIVAKVIQRVSIGGILIENDNERGYGAFCTNADELIMKGRVKVGRMKYKTPIGNFHVKKIPFEEIEELPSPIQSSYEFTVV